MRLQTGDLAQLAVSSSVVREMERRTIEEYGLPGAVLMENAGAAAAEIAMEMAPEGANVLVFAGAGNNAGDGFVIARYLYNAGRPVSIVTAVPPEKYKGDAALYLNVVRKMGLPLELWENCKTAGLTGVSLVVDALLGTGLSGALREPFPAMIECINSSGVAVLAVDIPSGLNADTGEVVTAAVRADRTVTFALPKKGLFAGRGPELAGEVILADIAIPRDVYLAR